MFEKLKQTALEVAQALLPISIAIVILQYTVVKMPGPIFTQFICGILMTALGMVLFLLGVKIGLMPMGEAIGNEIPQRGSLLYVFGIAFLVGFAATIAEPNVMILADEAQAVSNGAISGNLLAYVIAIGLGFFVALAMLRIIFGIPIAYVLAFGYACVIGLSFFTPPQLVPIAFDSGGFATGLMTIPFVLALGIGLTSVLSKRTVLQEGFGVIGLACLGPIIGVMIMGVISY